MLPSANRKTLSPISGKPPAPRSGWKRKALLLPFLAAVCSPSTVLGQTWTQQSPGTSPPARDSAAMAYDSVNHQTVLFGGENFAGTPLNDTWVYNGTTWTEMHPSTSPPARLWAGMAFDAAHGQVVLFGGTTTAGPSLAYLADTWLWNGANGTWTKASPLAFPTGRQGPAMAYGSPGGVTGVYLFGGSSQVGTALADTWIWNGTNWSSPGYEANPPASRFASLSYDTLHGDMVLFGGDNGSADMNDTWILNATGWNQEYPAHSPPIRDGQGQAWDTVRDLTVMFGGSNLLDTWTWNGTDWTQESTPNSPSVRSSFTMVYDIQHSDMVLFGGETASLSNDLSDTWTLGYSYTENWMLVGNNTSGPSVFNAAGAYVGFGALLFGGVSGASVQNLTWTWSGNEWSVQSGGASPPARQSAAMAYDPSTSQAVLFGGNASAGASPALLGDTWTYGGGGWTSPQLPAAPSARDGSAMVWDGSNSNIVLFGGNTGSDASDTWIWGGTTWSQAHPATSPPERSLHSLVYDGARGNVVLFGGISKGTLVNDTWTWNGTTWTQMTPANSPPARDNFSMVYDSVHGKVQIFGGLGASGALSDTWQWDGVNWTQVTPATSPAGRYGAASAYLPNKGQFLLAGGTNGTVDYADTWILASPALGTTTLAVGYYLQSYAYTISPTGGVGPYTFTVDGEPFTFAELGLALNSTTGAITGTVDVSPGVIPIGVTVQDSQRQSTDIVFFLPSDTPIAFSPGPLPDATMGTNYSVTLSVSGGTAPFTFSASGLPAGLTVNGNQIVGQCTASSAAVTLTVIDSLGGTASAGPFALNCNPAPLITNTSPLPTVNPSSFYDVTLTTNAIYNPPGAAPYTWSVPPNTLPPGLTLNASGTITGVPTTLGTSTFTVTFTDRWGATTSKQFQITVIATFSPTTSQLPVGTINVGYPAGAAFAVTGGVPPYTFTATALPPGLTIGLNTGAITGTPTQAGTFSTVFSVTDSISENVLEFVPITVAAAGTVSENWMQLSPSFSPANRAGGAMFYDSVRNLTILFGGNTFNDPPDVADTDSWNGTNWTALSPAASPSARGFAAAAFDATHGMGVLFGGMDQNGDALGDTWLWNGTTWTQANPATSPPARSMATMAYDGHQIVLFGGNPNYLSSLNDTWVWSGTTWTQVSTPVANTPPARGSAAMAYDSTHGKAVLFGGYDNITELDYSDTWLWDGVALAWAQASPATSPSARDSHGMVYDSMHGQAVVFGGNQASSFGALADTWAWNGTTWTQLNPPQNPLARSSYMMVYDAPHSEAMLFGGSVPEDEGYVNDTWIFSGPAVSNLSLPNATEGSPYSATIPVSGGTAPYLFVATVLPQGITLNASTGVFGGTPTVPGPYTIGVTIQDSNGLSIAPQLTLTVSAPLTALALEPATLPNATAATNYSEQLSATGGVAPYTFSATSLPAGLTLNSSNQIVGQCTAPSGKVVLRVADSALPAADVASVGPLTVNCNPLPSITTASPLPDGVVNVLYTANLQMTGGTAPITWSVTPGGTLPAGFKLTAAGVLSGTATAPLSAQFSVTVADFWGATTSKQLQLTITSVLSITTASLASGVSGTPYPSGVAIAATGGTGSNTYSLSATNLPPGLQINSSTGVIFGTPTQAGAFQPSFTVVDQTPQTVTKQITLIVLSNSNNPNWTNLNPITAPPATDTYATAYDPVRAVTVLFGGSASVGTWTLGLPSTWTQQAPAVSPTAALGAAMAWMSSESDIVLFGGQRNAAVFNQTYVWNGSNWTLKTTAVTPPARYFAGMAADPVHNRVVMFGGSSATGAANALNDTWVWDGEDWTQQFPANVPTAAYAPSLAEGPTGPVLFGGIDPASQELGQTWVWDGANWNLQTPAVSPPARYAAGMAFNSATGVTVLFGGYNGTNYLQDTWQWDGTNWTQLNPATVPAARDNINLAYDSGFNQTILFGGFEGAAPELGDTWALGGPAVVNTSLPPATAGVSYLATIAPIGGTPPYSFTETGTPQNLPAGLGLNASSGQITGATEAVGAYSVGVAVADSQGLSVTADFSLTVVAATTLMLSPTTLPNATAGSNYSVQLSASGGVLPYVFSATGLPAGLTLNSGNQIVGQCTAGSANVLLKVTDGALPVPNVASVGPLTVQCNAALTITTASPLSPATVQIPYTANFTASGGVPGYTWSATGLPSWLTLTPAGSLSGTPPSGSTVVSFRVTVTDSAAHSATAAFNLPVNAGLVITTTALPVATANVQYSTSLAASGGSGIYTWSATGLPATLTLTAAGVLKGAVSQPGPYPFQVKVTDSDAVTSSTSLTLLVSTGLPLSFVTQGVGPCVVNVSCPNQLTAAGGIPPYTFSVPANTNLYGLTLSANGSITGAPTSSGPFGIPVTLKDQQTSISTVFTVTVYPAVTVTPQTLPSGVLGVRYGIEVTATLGEPQYSWSVASGSLPPGLAIDPPSGTIFGTPITVGIYPFSLVVSDGLQTSPPQAFSIAITPPPLPLSIVSPSQLAAGSIGTAYSQSLMAAGGTAPYTWILTGGALPAGLALASSGAITGTPTTAQTANFTVKVTDAGGNTLSPSFSILIANPATVDLLTANPLPDGVVGVPYNYTIQVTGGVPPYFWSITQGQIPAGVTFDDTTGTFSGTPTLQGSFVFVLTLSDSSGTAAPGASSAEGKQAAAATPAAIASYTIRIVGPGEFQITSVPSLPLGTIGQSYSTTLAASGGVAPYQWRLVNGSLPAGLVLTSAGTLAGTPSTPGEASLLIQATDSTGAVATGFFQLNIQNPNAPAITTFPAPPSGLVGTPYQASLIAFGGHAPYTWSIGSGALPPGLALNTASGAVTGTPSQAGSFPFAVQVTDNAGVTATQGYTIRVNGATLQVAPSLALPNATANVPYTFGLSVTGGTAPYFWSLSAGGLLSGFSIGQSTGVLSGTPAQAGTYPFTVSVADSNFGVASLTYQLTVQSTGLTISPVSPTPATVGTAYGFGFMAANGAPPLTWSVISGSLPPGLQLAGASGLLAGTPTSAGSYSFTLQVTDVTTATAQARFTLLVNPPPFSILTTALPGGAAGTAYSQTLATTGGGTGTVSWTLTSGSLPPGLSLAGSTGVISGTPTAPGAYSFTVEAALTGQAPPTLATQALTLNIGAPPVAPAITLSGLPAASSPGAQPVVTITLASPYPLPILVTATLSITPNPGSATDLMFSNGSRTIQFTIPANTTQTTLAFQTGTLAGTIQLSLTLSAAGSNVTPSPAPVATTSIAASAPVIESVTAALTSGGFQVTVVGTSTTLNMNTATFQFTAAAGATLQTTTVTVNVSSQFAAWYQSSASLATGSQFALTVPFTIVGNVSTIASVTVTLTNSVGTSNAASTIIP